MFQYQGNNVCNKLAITLIFMYYVYNLEYIMYGGRKKNPTKPTKIPKYKTVVTKYKTKLKASNMSFSCQHSISTF